MDLILVIIVGLGLGSFVNALIWRIQMQSKHKNKTSRQYSIVTGRSMCPECKHELSARDLVPLLSWLILRGRCRYCHKPIPWQYPAVELITAFLFAISYIYWPYEIVGLGLISFIAWLVLLSGFIALAVYDIRWMLLPNRIVYPLYVVGVVYAISQIAQDFSYTAIIDLLCAIGIGGGIFYVLFQISKGKWIGGGDVKLGFLLGLVLLTAAQSFLMLFVASLLGMLYSLGLLLLSKKKYRSRIAFGPFLLIATYICVLWGQELIDWYLDLILL